MSDRKRKLPASKPRDAVLITGMYRSGASAVAGTAIRLGLAPPRTMRAPGADNPTGNFEADAVVDLNRSLLRASGRGWQSCQSFDPRTLGHVAQFGASCGCQRVLREEFGCASAFVMKDPRLALTLPVWLPALREARANVSVLIVARHPTEVVRSLARHDRLPEAVAAPLWLHHMLEAERATRSLPRAVILYEDLLRDWRWCMAWAGSCAGISWPTRINDVLPHIDSFVTPSLRHHVVSEPIATVGAPPVRDLIGTAWLALRKLRDDVGSRSAQDALDDVRSRFANWRASEDTSRTTESVVDFVPRVASVPAYLRPEASWRPRQVITQSFAPVALRHQRHTESSEHLSPELA